MRPRSSPPPPPFLSQRTRGQEGSQVRSICLFVRALLVLLAGEPLSMVAFQAEVLRAGLTRMLSPATPDIALVLMPEPPEPPLNASTNDGADTPSALQPASPVISFDGPRGISRSGSGVSRSASEVSRVEDGDVAAGPSQQKERAKRHAAVVQAAQLEIVHLCRLVLSQLRSALDSLPQLLL